MRDLPWTALFPRMHATRRRIPPPGRQVRDEIHTAFGTCSPVCLALHTHDTTDPLCRTYRGDR